MAVFIALPILTMLVILQVAIFSQVRLLSGSADLVLLALVAWPLQERVETSWQWSMVGGLLVSMATALPFGALLAGYLLTNSLASILKQRVWKVPILAMFILTFLGTLITHGISLGALWLSGTFVPVIASLNLITLPSVLLNLLLAAPVYILVGDLARWLHPREIEG